MTSHCKPNSIASFWQPNGQTGNCGAPPSRSTAQGSGNDDMLHMLMFDDGLLKIRCLMMDGSIDPRREVVADTAGVSGGESDEALLSPAGSPGVLDGVVGGGVSDEQDVVVQVAAAVVENTRSVSAPVGSISRHSERVALDGTLDVSTSLDSSHARNLERTALGLASAGLGSVGVFCLAGDTVILDKGQTLVVEPTVAALVSVGLGAVHDLLLGKTDLLPLEKSPRLKHTHSAESPARTAVTLVLHGGDLSLGDPINIADNGIDS